MVNSDMSNNRQNEYLGVNKIGKNIRKTPLNQPTFGNGVANNNGVGIGGSPARQQSQPQVYNISKNDFRSIVQQLTGSPSRNDPLPRPAPSNAPKHPNTRLQRIRPPPLMPINCPQMPPVVVNQSQGQLMAPPEAHFNHHNNSNFGRPQHHFGPLSPRGMPPPQSQGVPMAPPDGNFNNNFGRPPPPFSQISPRGMLPPQSHGMPMALPEGHYNNNFGRPPPQFSQPSPRGMPPPQYGRPWPTPALSPISAYMQQLQSCIGEEGPRPSQQQMSPQMSSQIPNQHHMDPQVHGYMPAQPPNQQQVPGQSQGQHLMHSQGPGHVQAQPPSFGSNGPPLPSPGTNGPGLLPSPGGYFNLLSPTPRSPYPLLSPGSQFPQPLSPNFAFSPFGQNGMFGQGPQPPLSPGISFPLSPSGFFPISSPRWRDH